MDWDLESLLVGVAIALLAPVVLELVRYHLTRHERRADRRDDFERNMLLELNDQLLALTKAAGDYYPRARDEEESGRTFRDANLRAMALAKLLDDEPVRDAVEAVRQAAWRVPNRPDPGSASWEERDVLGAMNEAYEAALALIAERLRDIGIPQQPSAWTWAGAFVPRYRRR